MRSCAVVEKLPNSSKSSSKKTNSKMTKGITVKGEGGRILPNSFWKLHATTCQTQSCCRQKTKASLKEISYTMCFPQITAENTRSCTCYFEGYKNFTNGITPWSLLFWILIHGYSTWFTTNHNECSSSLFVSFIVRNISFFLSIYMKLFSRIYNINV